MSTVTVPIRVRFRDTDAMGHVNNAVYLTYLEVARGEYWKRLTGIKSYKDVDFILAHISIDYKAPVYVDEQLEVGIRLTKLGRSSFTFEYEIRSRGLSGKEEPKLVATASSVQVLYDYERHTSKPISSELAARIRVFEGEGRVTNRSQ